MTDTAEAKESAKLAPLHSDTTPLKWVKDNLFNNIMNSVITVVLGVLVVFLLVQGFGWIANEEWEIVRVNLRNFMVGQFPSDELWRLWTSAFLLIGTFSLGTSAMAHNAYDDANEKGLVAERSTLLNLLGRFWPVLAFITLMVSFSETLLPVLGVIAGVSGIVVARFAGWALPVPIRSRAVPLMAIGTIVSLAILAGTGVIALAIAASELSRLFEGSDSKSTAIRTGGPILIGAATLFIVSSIGFEGFGWEDWGGLHLTLFATVVGISSGMPIGIMLAIGRRSELPVIKGFCVVFIEFVRGVPLISLLLFSSFILPLLFPLSVDTPETLTRAMIVITLFSAAYIAEIVRGGLQAVPKGQTEAAQASGMSAAKIQRLIVMPQALRAVIPAMVGQFISLFKDTSLIATIGVAEFFQYAAIANSQPDFLGKGLQLVTYSIIAVGYWSFAYTMSKESRRLEVQLGVGVR
jgi:general L-amino acid transport system permease protein